MKFTTATVALALSSFGSAAPAADKSEAVKRADYGKYANYGSYPDKYTSYNDYPEPQGGYGSYGSYAGNSGSSSPSSSSSTKPAPASTSTATSTSSATPSATAKSSYTVMSLRSASDIHFLQLNAAGNHFYLGGKTSSYCPTSVVSACPPGNATVFTSSNGLDTEVPGGQQIYLDPSGALSYTTAHSAAIPSGAVADPIIYTASTGTAFSGEISTNALGATGFIACPIAGVATNGATWQVFADIKGGVKAPSGNQADCLGFDAVTVDYKGAEPAAWQYS